MTHHFRAFEIYGTFVIVNVYLSTFEMYRVDVSICTEYK